MATQSRPARSRCLFRNSVIGASHSCRLKSSCPGGFRATLKVANSRRAAGVFDRLHAYGLDRMYADYDALALATEKHEYLALKYEIEQMRQRNSIQGYVVTELTDANWEANGLMTMWRHPKTFAEELGKLQQDDVVMANFATHNFAAGATVQVPLVVSHYSTASLEGAMIAWQTSDGQSGTMPLNKTPGEGEVATEAILQFKAASVDGRIEAGQGTPEDLDTLLDIGRNMTGTTICVLSDSCAVPVTAGIHKFRDEFDAHIRQHRCPFRAAGASAAAAA